MIMIIIISDIIMIYRLYYRSYTHACSVYVMIFCYHSTTIANDWKAIDTL